MFTSIVLDLAIKYPNIGLSLLSAGIAIILLLILITLPIIIFITNTIALLGTKFRFTRWFGLFVVKVDFALNILSKLFATVLVLSLAFAAHDRYVYITAIFIVATLITFPEFLLRLAAIIFRNQKFFEYDFAKESLQRQDQTDQLVQELNRLKKENVGLKFHYIYRDIFGSQILILNILKTSKKYMGDAIFKAIHGRTSYKDTYTFEQYMGFLVGLKLIETDETKSKYKITDLGKEFLDYLANNNLPLTRPTY